MIKFSVSSHVFSCFVRGFGTVVSDGGHVVECLSDDRSYCHLTEHRIPFRMDKTHKYQCVHKENLFLKLTAMKRGMQAISFIECAIVAPHSLLHNCSRVIVNGGNYG